MQSVKRVRRGISRMVLTGTACLLMTGLMSGCVPPIDDTVTADLAALKEQISSFKQQVTNINNTVKAIDNSVQVMDNRVNDFGRRIQGLVYAKECHSEVLFEVHEVGNNPEYVRLLNEFLTAGIFEEDDNGIPMYTGPAGTEFSDLDKGILDRFVDKNMADQAAIEKIVQGQGVGYYFATMAQTEFENVRKGIESLARGNGINVPLASAKKGEECERPSAFSRHVSVVGEVVAAEVEEEFVDMNVSFDVRNVSDSSTVWLMPERQFLSKLTPDFAITINGTEDVELLRSLRADSPYGRELKEGGQLNIKITHNRLKAEDVPLGTMYVMILRHTEIAQDEFVITRYSKVEINKANGSFPDQPLPVANPASQPACPPSGIDSTVAGLFRDRITGCKG